MKSRGIRVFVELFSGLFIGVIFGFAMIGGLWARMAVDEARIEEAEKHVYEATYMAAMCNRQAFAIRDSLQALRRVTASWGTKAAAR